MLQVIKRCACKSICPLRAIAVHPRSDVLFTFQSSRCFVRLCVCVYDSKIVLFKAYCTPMYGCQLWSSSFQYSLNKLNVAYNDGFRLLLNDPRCCSPSSLFVHHNVPTFDALIRKLIYAYGVVVTIVLKFWLINCSHQTFILSLNYLSVGASYCTNLVFCCFFNLFKRLTLL